MKEKSSIQQETREAYDRLLNLNHLLDAFQYCQRIDDILNMTLHLARQVHPYTAARLRLRNNTDKKLEVVREYNLTWDIRGRFDDAIKPVHTEWVMKEATLFFPTQKYCILPIPSVDQKNPLGVLEIETGTEPLTPHDHDLMKILLNRAGNAIENIRVLDELRGVKEYNENIIQSMRQGLILLDRSGRITFLNPRAKEILGHSSKNFIDLPLDEVFDFSEVSSWATDVLQKGGEYRTRETRLKSRWKKSLWIGYSLSPFWHGLRLTGGVFNFQDITRRKKIESSLQESEEKYRSLVENVNIGVYRNTGGPHGKFLQANPALARIFGYSPKEFKDVSVSKLYANPEERRKFIQKISEHGSVRNEVLVLKKKNGETIYGSITAKIQRDETGAIKWMDGVIEDITERIKAEKELAGTHDALKKSYDELKSIQRKLLRAERLASIGKLASVVAHEVNNPLAAMKTRIQILAEDMTDHEQKNHLEKVDQQINRLAGMVRNLLDFSRTRISDLRMQSVSKILLEILDLEKFRLEKKDIPVHLDIPPGLPDAMVDARGLEQVFLNIIQNAANAMEDGGNLKIRFMVSDSGKSLTLEFSDSGCGMNPHQVTNVFDEFFTTRDTGTGLGLTICRSIIEQHGGNIIFNSKPGEGTTVSIILPLPGKGEC